MNLKKIYKPKNFFFFFHKKFDTGTWTIVFASITLTLYSSIFLLLLAYSFPKCFCADPYPHLNVLPSSYIAAYVIFLLVLLAGMLSCVTAIYGTFKAREKMLYPFLGCEAVTELVMLVGSIMLVSWLAKMDQYLLFSNDTYMDMTKMVSDTPHTPPPSTGPISMVLKADVAAKVEKVMESIATLMETFFASIASLDQNAPPNQTAEINLNNLMDALLNDYILGLLGGLKLIMKCGTVLICIGLNSIFVCGCLTTFSHIRRLRNGHVTHYQSSIPGCLINSAVMTNSARSTATESLNDDWSSASNYKSLPPRNCVYASCNTPNNDTNYRTSTTKSRRSSHHHLQQQQRGTNRGNNNNKSAAASVESDSNRSEQSSQRTSVRHHSKPRPHNLSVVGKFPQDRYL